MQGLSSRRFFRLLAGAGSVLVLLSLSVDRGQAQIVNAPNEDQIGKNEIVIWRAEAPDNSRLRGQAVIPASLLEAAENIGYTIRMESFSSQEFAATLFKAVEMHQEPDILFLKNHLVLTGGRTTGGTLAGIEQNPDVSKSLVEVTELLSGRTAIGMAWSGWQYLIATSKHYAAARMLALRAPDCEGLPVSDPVPNDLAGLAETTARAYLEHAPLSSYEDAQRLKTEGARRGPVQVGETITCGAWGNERLSFLSVVSTYHSEAVVGHLHMLVVLRKPRDEWKLLALSTDPISNAVFLDKIALNAGVFRLKDVGAVEAGKATLVSPGDRLYPQPNFGERFGSFQWLPSPDPSVVAEVAEFSYENEARLFLRISSQSKGGDGIVSAGSLWHTGTPWVWRIWSVTDGGDLVFSEAHTFVN